MEGQTFFSFDRNVIITLNCTINLTLIRYFLWKSENDLVLKVFSRHCIVVFLFQVLIEIAAGLVKKICKKMFHHKSKCGDWREIRTSSYLRQSILWHFVGNKAEGRISKWVLQEKQSTSNFPKNQHFLSPDTHTNECFKKTKHAKFSEIFLTPWYAHVRVRIKE